MSIIEEIKFRNDPEIINGKVVQLISRPLIRTRISFNHKLTKNPITCLLDSGCDRNLFPSQYGELVGIKVKSGKLIHYNGIGNSNLIAYSHLVKIYIVNTKISFNTFIDFSETQQIPLLGRCGFFSYFKKVVFDEENGKVILEF